jgi:cytochrome c biogenesis protein CcmG, thiol:disulfide interchange protein DsbE
MVILRKIAAWCVVAIAALVVVFFAMPSYRQGEASVAGKTADDFSIEISGKPGHLSDFKGRVVVLNFWATWCPPCVEETPALNKLQKYIASRNGVVLGVAADEDPAAYEKFLRDQGVIFQTYRDPGTKDNHSPIAGEYGTSMYPETYVIDRHGKIARKIIGFQQWDSPEMLAYFDAILGQT